jgi:hypothetical protein
MNISLSTIEVKTPAGGEPVRSILRDLLARAADDAELTVTRELEAFLGGLLGADRAHDRTEEIRLMKQAAGRTRAARRQDRLAALLAVAEPDAASWSDLLREACRVLRRAAGDGPPDPLADRIERMLGDGERPGA